MDSIGRNLGQSNVRRTQDFYVYADTISSIASGASDTRTVKIEADANFSALKINYFASIAGAAQTADTRVIPLITVQITDQGSGRNLFNQAVPLPVIAGTGELPFLIPLQGGRAFRANSSILFTFTNYSAATTYRLDYGLVGVKEWA